MKKTKLEYLGTWLDYYDELLDYIQEPNISNNFSYFKECFEYGILPEKAVKMNEKLVY